MIGEPTHSFVIPWAHTAEAKGYGSKCEVCGGDCGTKRIAFYALWLDRMFAPICRQCELDLAAGAPWPHTVEDARRGIVAVDPDSDDIEATPWEGLI